LYTGELTQPYILETASQRSLHFTHEATQSVMSLDDPNALLSPYTRKMMSFLLFNPNPKNILIVGLGGGCLPKFCYRHLQKATIAVVEIDSRVIALRDEFCIPADDHRFRVVCADGVKFMSELSDNVDVILIDAFDSIGIAPSLAASDFYVQAALRLSPNGVLVMNLSGAPARFAQHIRRVHAAFGSTLLVPVVANDNLLLFAFRKPISVPTTARYESRAEYLQTLLALEFPRYLRRICQGRLLTRRTA
jgi:spermidine synthase